MNYIWVYLEELVTFIIILITSYIPESIKYTRFFGPVYYYFMQAIYNRIRKSETVNYVDSNTVIETNHYGRSLSGTNTNLQCPLRGSVLQPILYATPMHRVSWDTKPIIRKSILKLLTRTEQIEEDKINVLAGAWIQFMIHDWFNTTNEVYEKDGHRYNHNVNDHWWSGSQIYGTEEGRRQFGKVKTRENSTLRDGDYLKVKGEYLPLDKNNAEVVGFYANFWSGLGFLHHLFVLEHNYIVDKLKQNGCEPSRVFDTARLIITAMIAKIHTIDFSTAAIQNKSARLSQYVMWHGLKGRLNIKTSIGIIDGAHTTYDSKTNFTHNVEFISVYRIHSLLPDVIKLRSYKDDHEVLDTIPFDSIILKNSSTINQTREGKLNLLYTIGVTKACKLCLYNYPTTLRNLGSIDLAEIELIRDKERGVPKYNEMRRTVFLKPYADFTDMTDDQKTIDLLREAYPEGIDTMDAIIGLHLEEKIPGTIFGETTYVVLSANTGKRIDRDRFLTECYTPEYYTKFGINHVESSSMSKILLRHYPEIEHVIQKDTNAFIPRNDRDAKKLYEDVTGTFLDNFFYL
jgi:hypothetical protein